MKALDREFRFVDENGARTDAIAAFLKARLEAASGHLFDTYSGLIVRRAENGMRHEAMFVIHWLMTVETIRFPLPNAIDAMREAVHDQVR